MEQYRADGYPSKDVRDFMRWLDENWVAWADMQKALPPMRQIVSDALVRYHGRDQTVWPKDAVDAHAIATQNVRRAVYLAAKSGVPIDRLKPSFTLILSTVKVNPRSYTHYPSLPDPFTAGEGSTTNLTTTNLNRKR